MIFVIRKKTLEKTTSRHKSDKLLYHTIMRQSKMFAIKHKMASVRQNGLISDALSYYDKYDIMINNLVNLHWTIDTGHIKPATSNHVVFFRLSRQ